MDPFVFIAEYDGNQQPSSTCNLQSSNRVERLSVEAVRPVPADTSSLVAASSDPSEDKLYGSFEKRQSLTFKRTRASTHSSQTISNAIKSYLCQLHIGVSFIGLPGVGKRFLVNSLLQATFKSPSKGRTDDQVWLWPLFFFLFFPLFAAHSTLDSGIRWSSNEYSSQLDPIIGLPMRTRWTSFATIFFSIPRVGKHKTIISEEQSWMTLIPFCCRKGLCELRRFAFDMDKFPNSLWLFQQRKC